MCGLIAIATPPNSPCASEGLLRERLSRAMDRTEHRGPDERGQVLLDEWAGLGHVRLSITDVANGQQPISNEDGSVTAIVNGEFYDFERIREELRGRGHTFSTASDSEILVHLWEERGPECLSELRGEFAFVLACQKSRQMFAARDRFGIKPLYLARQAGELVLASEVKALFAAGVDADWDPVSVFDSLHGCRHEGRPSVFRGVEEVPPGHYLLHDAATGTDEVRRYWSPDYPTRGLGERLGLSAGPCADEAEATERVRGVLEESVALRASCELPVVRLLPRLLRPPLRPPLLLLTLTVGRVRQACYLSGGVDSAAVLGMASRLSGRSIDAFTVRFAHPDYDESVAAREMAEHAGSRYHEVLMTDQQFADSFEASVVQCEGPQINGHACARFLLSKAVHDAGFKVVMGGEGGDEMFAGYGFVRAALPQDQRAAGESAEAQPLGVSETAIHAERPQEVHDALWRTSPAFATATKLLSLPSDLTGVMGEGVMLAQQLLHPDFLESQRRRDPFLEFLRQFRLRDAVTKQPWQVLLHIWMRSHFPGYVLAAERLDAYHAVEMRLPFLDHKLFEVCRELPASVLYKGNRNKALLRKIAAPDVTERITNAPKHPFFAPPTALLPGRPLTELMRELICGSDFGALPFFDQPRVVGWLDKLEKMEEAERIGYDPVVYYLASLAVLQRHYVAAAA